MADEKIAFRYEAKKAKPIPGVKSGSLTQTEYEALSPTLMREVLHSGFWTRLNAPKTADNAGKDKGDK